MVGRPGLGRPARHARHRQPPGARRARLSAGHHDAPAPADRARAQRPGDGGRSGQLPRRLSRDRGLAALESLPQEIR